MCGAVAAPAACEPDPALIKQHGAFGDPDPQQPLRLLLLHNAVAAAAATLDPDPDPDPSSAAAATAPALGPAGTAAVPRLPDHYRGCLYYTTCWPRSGWDNLINDYYKYSQNNSLTSMGYWMVKLNFKTRVFLRNTTKERPKSGFSEKYPFFISEKDHFLNQSLLFWKP